MAAALSRRPRRLFGTFGRFARYFEWQQAMPCAGPTAGGDSIASARMSRKRASLGADRTMERLRTLLGIGLGLAIVAGAGWYISQTGTASTSQAARQGRFAAGAATPV